MLCEKCGKNEAVIHYSEIVNGKKTEMSLCEECAHEMGISSDPFENSNGFDAFGSLFGGSLLSGLFGTADAARTKRNIGRSSAEHRCPVCGASMSEIAKRGMVGCAECYRTFKSELAPSIRRIHGDVKYKGKAPAACAEPSAEQKAESELAELREELSEAVKREDFERAAQLRDKIREMGQ